MLKFALTAAAIALAAAASPASAASGRAQVEADLARELPFLGFDVDVTQLTTAQLGQIHYLVYSDRGTIEKRALIRSALGEGILSTLFRRR